MLLKKANTITTPTAYSNGFLHSVKPEVVLGSNIYDNNINEAINSGTWTDNGDGTFTVTGTGSPSFAIGVRDAYAEYLTDGKKYKWSVQGENVSLAVYNSSFGVVASGVSPLYFTAESLNRLYISATDGTSATYSNILIQEATDADFTFTRNSSATRVNELGYIEDVQIIGGELVSNGDFEQIGSEEVTNGSFDTDSDWIKGTGWSISGGKARSTTSASSTYLTQTDILTADKIYKIVFTVSDYVGGTMKIAVSGQEGNSITSDGTYTEYLKTTGTNFSIKSQGGSFIGSIDNVSVKEVGQDWTLTQATVEGGKLLLSTSDGSYSAATQSLGTIGRLYRITLDVADIVGTVSVTIGGGTDVDITTNGSHTFEITSTSTTFEVKRKFGITNVSATIDNISVKEVTDDTNLPRINYEGFTYENGLPVPYSGKGHLLLEPTATNRIRYSEDFSKTTWTKNNTITASSVVSPDGGNNSYLMTCNDNLYNYIFDNVAQPTGYEYANSIFVKNNVDSGWVILRIWSGGGGAGVNVWFDLTNGVLGTSNSTAAGWTLISADAEDYGNGWYRLSVVGDAPTGNAYIQLSFTDGDGVSTYTNVSGKSCYIFGAQMERENGYVTSYIPTLTSTAVTRLGETCNNATHSFPSEGVLYAEIAALANDGTNRAIAISDGTNTNRIILFFWATSNSIRCQGISATLTQFDMSFAVPNVLDFNKVACRYKDNDFSLWVNGVQVGTDTSGTAPTGLNELSFDAAGSLTFYGKTKMVATFPYLSNDEMECLTGEGYGTFEALAAAYSYTIK